MSLWNPNWQTSQGRFKLLKPALNELRSAMIERNKPAYLSLSSKIFEVSTGDFIFQYKWYGNWVGWFTSFQSHIDTLMGNYINHLDNDGDWDGIQEIPVWTEETMLEAIGDEERLAVPIDAQLCRKWIWQQFKILNMLRWCRRFTYYDYPEEWTGLYRTKGYDGVISGTDWDAVKLEYSETAWGTPRGVSYFSSLWGGYWYSITSFDYGWEFTTRSDFKYGIDIYMKAKKYNYPEYNTAFLPLGSMIEEDIFYKKFTMEPQPVNTFVSTGWIFEDDYYEDSVLLYPPKPTATTVTHLFGVEELDVRGSRGLRVEKYDVEDGFQWLEDVA